MIQLVPGQHIHLVGVGGAGLSAIARILLEQGYYVSGSDRSSNALTEALKRDGALIYEGHDPANVKDVELVIVSSAIPRDNIEVISAHAQGVPVVKRFDIIRHIMSGFTGIAIAGTHGKTTTTAMATHIFIQTGLRPSYIIGGVLQTTGRNAGMGDGDIFLIEADEYDNMYHGLRPEIEVVTNVEYDHPDFFRTPNDLTESFSRFVGLLPRDGLLIACADDPVAMIFADNRAIVNLPTETYGITNPRAHWKAVNVRINQEKTVFEVVRGEKALGSVELQVPGHHNVLNALAALIVAGSQGVPFREAAKALATFRGTARRFELRGEVDDIAVIDDYAHHPTAIQLMISVARQRYPGRTVWAVWQPHTYTRIQSLLDEYAKAFDAADHILVTPIYAARERPIPGVSSAVVAEAMGHPDVRLPESFDEAVDILLAEVTPPAVILIMSAGDAPQIGIQYLERREKG